MGTIKGTGFDVEDVDEDADGGEDVGLLSREVGFCEGVLSGLKDTMLVDVFVRA